MRTMVKRLIMIFLILSFAVTAFADPKATISYNFVRFSEKSYLIIDKNGREIGVIRPNYLQPGEYRILDAEGEQTGRIKRDRIRKDGYIIER